ncbi:MAG: leucine zipper domain-containing protein, partial [Actinomycetes bacterium]
MAHANARLTEFGRLLLIQRITELGWPPAQAAESLGVSRATAYKWLGRYRAQGPAGLADRPSRPHRCPHALTAAQVRRVLVARRRRRPGPHRLSDPLAMPRSTVYGVLRRHGMSRLSHTDRASGLVVRYQREHPGELVHLDVKKLGRIPDGGGHRIHGRARQHRAEASATTMFTRPSMTAPGSPSARSWATRRPRPAPGSWARRPGFFAEHGVRIQRVLTDNA